MTDNAARIFNLDVYTREIKNILEAQMATPSESFIRFFASRVYSGRKMTQTVLEQFRGITKKAFKQFINEKINRRLKYALDKEREALEEGTDSPQAAKPQGQGNIDIHDGRSSKQKDDERIETTPDELEGFQVVRSILSDTLEKERIFYRDTVRYFGILLDDRRTLCRLYFDGKQKYIVLLDKEKRNMDKIPIDTIDEIRNYSERLINATQQYLKECS